MCIKLLAQDDDGYPFVDYLGQTFHTLTKKQIPVSIIEKAYENVIKASNYFKEAKNSKLAFRYAVLRDYFDDRLSQNSIVPDSSETIK